VELYISHINVSSGKPEVESHSRYRFFWNNVSMTSKHGARAIHYEFHQLYHFSACTGIVSVNPTHPILPQGIPFITKLHPALRGISLRRTNRHPTLQGIISPRTNLLPILQGVNSDSRTYESKVYLRVGINTT
jgi:hypothetical protein